MGDVLTLILSFIGAITNSVVYWIYSGNFVERYKKYLKNTNNKIIRKNIAELKKLVKEKQSTNLEDKLTEISEKIGEDNKPLRTFDDIYSNIKWSLSLFGISLLTGLLYNFAYSGKVLNGDFTWNGISIFTLILGAVMFLVMLYNMISLTNRISKYELSK